MKRFIFILAVILTSFPAYSVETVKQQAYTAAKKFFHVNNQRLSLTGLHFSTPLEYGKTCQFIIDFTDNGNEYLAVKGEFTPFTKKGDGIFFSANDDTFTKVFIEQESLILEQEIIDSFFTWTKSNLTLHKKRIFFLSNLN